MKNLISTSLISLALLQSGCGTIFGGRISECQSHRPPTGQPKRAIRPAAIIFDLLTVYVAPISLGIDFITGGMYKPCEYVTITPKTNNQDTGDTRVKSQIVMVDSKPKGTVSYMDYKNGFRDAKFETPIDSFSDMAL